MKTIIQIKDGQNQTYYQRNELYMMGFRFEKKTKVWTKKETDEQMIEYYKLFAKRKRFVIRTYYDTFERSHDYRRKFFIENKPQIKGKYFCAYCGALLDPDEVTVDHIIPVVKAQRNNFAKWILNKKHITDINDPKNLAPACLECNTKKGKKIGLWTLRGFIGKNKSFWIIGYSVFIIFALIIFILAYEVIRNGL